MLGAVVSNLWEIINLILIVMNDQFTQQFIDLQMRNEHVVRRFILPFHRINRWRREKKKKWQHNNKKNGEKRKPNESIGRYFQQFHKVPCVNCFVSIRRNYISDNWWTHLNQVDQSWCTFAAILVFVGLCTLTHNPNGSRCWPMTKQQLVTTSFRMHFCRSIKRKWRYWV